MNLCDIYNIAWDMLVEKKSHQFGFNADDKSTITVITTNDGEIFKASNGSSIQNGQLKDTCSEYEAVTSMLKTNKNRIEYLVTLNVETGAFVMPCNDCIDLITQINSENLDCNVLVDANECVKLSTLLPNNGIDLKNSSLNGSQTTETPKQNQSDISNFDDWLDGWDDDNSSNTKNNSNNGNDTINNPFDNALNPPIRNARVSKGFNTFEDNPMPNQPVNEIPKKQSSYYQSRYLNMEPNSSNVSQNNASNSQSNTTFKGTNNDITNRMRQNGLSDSDKKDFNKQRLYNAFTVETVINLNGTSESGYDAEIAEKQTLSKKELIKMAKEKKKMAKRDAKILEASNKKK